MSLNDSVQYVSCRHVMLISCSFIHLNTDNLFETFVNPRTLRVAIIICHYNVKVVCLVYRLHVLNFIQSLSSLTIIISVLQLNNLVTWGVLT